MAIKALKNGETYTVKSGEVALVLNNGDVTKINDVIEMWSFNGEESLIRFALTVLESSPEKVIGCVEKDGKIVALSPKENLLKKKSS